MPINDYTHEELLEICENLYDTLLRKHSIYVTYQLFYDGGDAKKTIHCNYIKRIDTDVLSGARVQLSFGGDSFKFLGNGYNANKLHVLVNIVDNKEIEDGYKLVSPKSNEWKIYDMGGVTKEQLQNENFIVSIDEFDNKDTYNLDYINYPQNDSGDPNFGDEIFFFGNVDTEIQANIHTTDLPIKLPLNEYNVTTNRTWDGETSVYVTEVGIYDDDDNLVAIGKFGNPIEKNPNISRTIIFSLDF